MLVQLSVQNIALVERAELEIDEGLTVLTGETGAGKSVLVQAASLLLGGRATADLVRSGASEAVVEGLFRFAPGSALDLRLQARGIEASGGELLVRRTVGAGRARVHLNGQLGTVAMLQDILRGQLDVTGQHEHVSLLQPEVQLELVDAFGGLHGQVAELTEIHRRVVGYRAMLEDLDQDDARRAQREDYLQFALDELRTLAPQPDELEQLERERRRLGHAVELQQMLTAVEAELYSADGAAVETLGRAERRVRKAADLDPTLVAIAAGLEDARVRVEDVAQSLSRVCQTLETDPERLEQVEERADNLRRVARKYGGTVEAALVAQREMEEELDRLEHDEARRADLESALEADLARLDAAARRLTEARSATARSLEKAVVRELGDLAMAPVEVHLRLRPMKEPGPRGAESVEVEIAPNPKEPPRPLRRIASGGELSRILLAFKRALADRAPAQSYLFDEIDTGIGGAVAEVLGRKLREVSRMGQVICVTHLPQVAAQAHAHVLVEKHPGPDGRSITRLRRLEHDDRVGEVARMLGGLEITAAVRSAAAEMLEGGKHRPAATKGRRRGRSIR